jgi:hypothetical protein
MPVRAKFKARINQIAKLRDKQIRRAEKATDKTLERFGAIIRQDARKLIGAPAKKKNFSIKVVDGKEQMIVTPPSKPRPAGSPPKARTTVEGASLRTIIYNIDDSKKFVRIGPKRLPAKGYNGKLIPEIHEFGATITVKLLKIRGELTQQNVRKRKGQLTQVSSRLILVESKSGKPTVVKMPKRPYMRPAFDRHKNKATKIWKEYYKAMRGR